MDAGKSLFSRKVAFQCPYFLFVFVHCTTNCAAHEQLFSPMVESDLFSHLFDPLLGVYIIKGEGLRSIGHYSCEWFIQWTIVNRSIYIKKRSKALPVWQQLTSKNNKYRCTSRTPPAVIHTPLQIHTFVGFEACFRPIGQTNDRQPLLISAVGRLRDYLPTADCGVGPGRRAPNPPSTLIPAVCCRSRILKHYLEIITRL